MIRKPSTCGKCPLYGPGEGFVPDNIKNGCRIIVYHTFPSEDEEHGGIAGIEETKAILRNDLVLETGLQPHEIGFANVVRCRHRYNRMASYPPDLTKGNRPAIYECRRYDSLPSSCELGITVGADALKALFGHGTVADDWRGYYQWHEGLEINMFHIRSYSENSADSRWFRVTEQDIQKIGKYMRGQWPVPQQPFTFLR